MEPASSAAMCAQHPDRVADGGTCQRCGSFMCGACRAPDAATPLCLPCYERRYGSRMVGHVRVFAVVLAVHGALVVLVGLFALVYGGSLAASFGSMPLPEEGDLDQMRFIENTTVAVLLGMALVHFAVGAVQAFAARRLWQHRSRGFGIGAVILGVVTVFGCYCAPTSFVVLIWGLIVLLHPAVAERFAVVRRSGT